MSIDATIARVSHLQAMLSGSPLAATGVQATATATGVGSNDTSFASQLSKAQGAKAAGATAGGKPTQYDADINAAAARNGIDPALLKGLIRAESGFNPKAGSGAGAQGLTQLMPGTARGLGVNDPFDPKQSIEGGAKYLAQQLKAFGGDPQKGLAAYNAGPGAVQKYGGVPPYAETQGYVKRVMEYAREYGYGGSGGGASASAAAAPASITGLGKIT